MAKTTIEVTDGTWKRLHQRKERGQSFNDVLEDLLDEAETEVSA